MIGNEVRDFRRVLVQTAAVWPGDESTYHWTTQETLTAPASAQGWSLEIGEATLQQIAGLQKKPGATAVANSAEIASIAGGYVRLLIRDDAGEVSLTLSTDKGKASTWSPFWWGIVIEKDTLPNNAPASPVNSVVRWRCAGILYELDVQPKRGFEVGALSDGTVAIVDPGDLLGFNLLPRGDRAASVQRSGAYVHQRNGLGVRWNAFDAVNHLLMVHATDGGPQWSLSGQSLALTFSETWDCFGQSYLTRIGRILAPRYGVGFRAEVISGQPVLVVTMTAPADVGSAFNLDLNPYLLPGNPEVIDLDVRSDKFVEIVELREDYSHVLDELGVVGNRAWRARTLLIKPDNTGDLIAGWNAQAQTNWANASWDWRASPHLAHVYRRFVLNPELLGTLIPCARVSLATDAVYGFNGEDSTQTADSTGLVVDAIEFTRDLPLYQGVDYTNIINPAPLPPSTTLPLVQAMVWQVGSGGDYRPAEDWLSVTVEDGAAAILLGHTVEHADDLRQMFVDGMSLAVTIGLRDPLPLRVLWRRDPATYPRSTPRRRMIHMPEVERWILDDFTQLVPGPRSTSLGTVVRDDTPLLSQTLVRARPWVENAAVTVRWRRNKVLDVDQGYHPGALLRNVILGDRTIAVNGVIGRRGWTTTFDGYCTDYAAERVQTDLRGLL